MWDDADAVAFARFVDTHPNFFPTLMDRVPKIETSSTEVAAITGAKHAGAEAIIGAIRDMMTSPIVVREAPFIDPSKD